MHANWTNKAFNKAKNKGSHLLMKKRYSGYYNFLSGQPFFEVNFFDRHKNSSIFHFCELHTRSREAWHLKPHNLKDLQSTSHGKIQVVLDLQSRPVGVRGLTQNICIIIATWQQSYGDAMVTTSGCLIKQKIYHP